MNTHTIPIGSKVKVRFEAGWVGGRFYRSGWRVAKVTEHSRIGTACGDGTPTYDVTMRDGAVLTHCSADCVKVA